MHIIIRIVWYIAAMTIIMIKLVELDGFNPIVMSGLLFFSTFSMETIFYINHKAEAKMFLSTKVMSLHEE